MTGRPEEAPLTDEEKVIGGIHAKLLLGRGRFTRAEADVLLQAHDRLRVQAAAQGRVIEAARDTHDYLDDHLHLGKPLEREMLYAHRDALAAALAACSADPKEQT